MRLTRNALLLSCAFALVASAGAFKSPPNGIEVRLVNHTGRPMLAHHYGGPEACKDAQPLPRSQSETEFLLRVDPGNVATLSMQPLLASAGAVSWCIVAFSFRPETGFSYEASVELTNDACLLTFTRRAAAASDATPAPFVHRIYRTPLFASRGFCVPLEPQQKIELGLAAQ